MTAALVHAAVIGIGGFLGALARYGVGGLVHRIPGTGSFPYGTLVVNLLGCLLIGVFAALMEERQMFATETRLFILVGLLGGFTTFSTFGYESLVLLRESHYLRLLANVGIQVVGGIALVWLGYTLVMRTFPRVAGF
ncbi:fluoride efflux transporter CrcB [soil metagenome]